MAKEKTRVADIRGWAKKARMKDFGEQHVRAGTSADEFFNLLTERMTVGATRESQNQRDFEKGRRAFAKLLGRDVAETKDKGKEDDDEDDDERDDDVDADDPEDEGDAKKKPADDEQANKRGARAWRRLADRFGLATAPARNSARKF